MYSCTLRPTVFKKGMKQLLLHMEKRITFIFVQTVLSLMSLKKARIYTSLCLCKTEPLGISTENLFFLRKMEKAWNHLPLHSCKKEYKLTFMLLRNAWNHFSVNLWKAESLWNMTKAFYIYLTLASTRKAWISLSLDSCRTELFECWLRTFMLS